MRKIIAAINITPGGFCDHAAMMADNEIHDHYSAVNRKGSALISVKSS